MKFSESEILKGIVDGNRHIFTWLYQEVGPGILGYIIKNSGTEENGKDFFRLAMITVRNKIINKTYNDQGKIKQFIFSIARNMWKDELKKRKRKRERISPISAHEYKIENDGLTAEQQLIKDESYSMLHRALKLLKEKCQSLFRLYYFEEKSFVEIAQMENSKPGTIRKRHSDCKDALKEKITNPND